MGVVNTLTGVGNIVQKGGSVLNLAGVAKAILKPENVDGIDGLVFSIPESETLSLKANITDHYVENNTAMQNHIAIAPIEITLSGKVAELVLSKSELQKYAETVLTTLGTLGVISPKFSQSALQALSAAQRIQQAVTSVIAKAQDITDLLGFRTARNKQQEYYDNLKDKLDGLGLFTVQTPWITLKNMAITSASFEQDESTKDWSTVTVSLKQISFAETKVTSGLPKGKLEAQKMPENNKGIAPGKDESFAVKAGKYFGVIK